MRTLFTIGHSNVPFETLRGLLTQHAIACVVDVRSVPFSRYCPQYNQKALARALAEAGIAYRFEGERLGGRIKDPDCFLGKTVPEFKKGFLQRIDYATLVQKSFFVTGLQTVCTLAETMRVVLMCSEENPDACHRNLLLTRRLLELGHDVLHIRGDGRLEPGVLPKSTDHGSPSGLLGADGRDAASGTSTSCVEDNGPGEQLRFL